MFGHRVIVTLRFPAQPRLLNAGRYGHQLDATSRALLYHTRRTYATPGRPRNVVGEPSKPVKRAVKRAAPKATAADSPAKQKNVQKKEEAKKPAKKAAAKKPVRKEVTEEQAAAKKAAKQKRLATAETTVLRKAALRPPKVIKSNAWSMFVAEKSQASADLHSKGPGVKERLANHMKSVAAAWKECTTADIEHYNHLAHTTKEKMQAEYKRWVESHTPEQIAFANRARAQLQRRIPRVKGTLKKWPPIHDERSAKRFLTAYLQFNINRQASGDFANIHLKERAKLIGQEWKSLSEDEKKKYRTLQEEDAKRWGEDYSSTFGHLPPSLQSGPQAVAAAA